MRKLECHSEGNKIAIGGRWRERTGLERGLRGEADWGRGQRGRRDGEGRGWWIRCWESWRERAWRMNRNRCRGGLGVVWGGSQESIRMTLAESPSRRGHGTWIGLLLWWPGSGGIWTSTHPQNLQPKFFPAYKKLRDNDGAETEGKANQWPAWLKAHPIDMNQSLTVSMILYYDCRQESSITVLWEAPSSRDPQLEQRSSSTRIKGVHYHIRFFPFPF